MTRSNRTNSQGQRPRSGRRQRPAIDTDASSSPWTPLEAKRCEILSRHAARLAEDCKVVRDFRQLLFGSPTRKVSRLAAVTLLKSPATQFLDFAWFERARIPFAEHTARLLKVENLLGEDSHVRRASLEVMHAEARERVVRDVTVSDASSGSHAHLCRIPDARGTASMVVLSGTCFDFIRHAAEYLQTQLLWDQADAIAFLMTGRCPSLAPLTVTYDVAHSPDGNPLRAEVVIRLQPFVSSDSVAAALTRVRLDIGRRLRPGPSMAERTLAIFDFVEQARASAGWTRPPWSELVIAWDADPARDGWQYEGDRRNFRRDYERARQLLLEDYLPARQRLDVQQPTAEAKSKAPRRKRA